MNDVAKVLMINVKFLSPPLLNQENLNINTFIIFFKIIHLTKIITTDLENYLFDHIINRNNLELNYHKSDIFIYITLEKNISNEFYEIMIDIKVSNQLMAKYEQYLIYKKNIISI